ncbi:MULTISPECIES: NUDIX domain-containing protein [Kitasatospora]|uniref:Putative hydrolase n=1 Tax=Kitasatospora setae (strain ATCC 33774 / DSM 43861 / JCM 3304 / KCC A-0304 / NBRC 14216 / KM-6054) TaxID=452652 RepID=E4N8B9_KITSK|nr:MULTISPECIES: NUDIX domain-containing protein [Kitasatospora]BAJ27450.1 putative hydrolase [Kitasatospora setae KM-6054]
MGIPAFLAELREVVGHRPLWLSGVSAVVVDEAGRVLLGKRVDNGRWALIGGIIDPGEQPADTVVRECREETGVTVLPERLVSVAVSPMIEYPNGDRTQYLDLVFRCRPLSGEARVNDDESTEVGWFHPDELPELEARALEHIARALAGKDPTHFELTEGREG